MDFAPLPGFIEDDPAARAVVPFVMANGLLLPTEILDRPPADPEEFAEAVESVIRNAADKSGRWPETVILRHDEVAQALFTRMMAAERGFHVEVDAEMSEMRGAIRGFLRHSGRESGVVAGCVETWAGWELGDDIVAELFRTAAEYFHAAPWTSLENGDLIQVETPGGATWSACVLGNAGEIFGLNIFEDPDDFDLLLEGDPELMGETCGEMIALLFGPKAQQPKKMTAEVLAKGWEVAGRSAFPWIATYNTPGYGLSIAHVRDLIGIMKGIPRVVDERQAPPISSDSDPFDVPVLQWRDEATGFEFELPDFR